MLKFLGIGGAFESKLKNCSAFYKKDNKLLLIDCGENIFEEIKNNNILQNIEEINILIAHFHTDHIGSIGSLLFYCDRLGIKKVNIIYPKVRKLKQLLNLLGMNRCNYKLYNPKKFKNIKIESYKQNHSFMEAYGYKISLNNKKIFYSGDTKTIPKSILTEFLNNKIDYFYQDVRKEFNNYHISLDELNFVIPYEYRNRINCMHFNTEEEIKDVLDNGYSIVKKIGGK